MSNNVIKNIQMHMEKLCLDIGSRHVGSPGEAKAEKYICGQFQKSGLACVLEKYPTTGWDCGEFSLTDETDGAEISGAHPCFFSNACDFTDEILWLKGDDLQTLANLPVRGRLCMVEMVNQPAGVFGRNGVAELLDRLGAGAALFISDHPVFPDTKIQRSPFLEQLATLAVAYNTAFDLRARQKQTHKFHLKIAARKFEHESANVIARVIGAGPNKAVIGCHHDTAPGIQGAADNAAGTAALLEFARLLKGRTRDWSVDFTAFGAEEYIPKDFPPGSGGYVKLHKNENIRFLLNFDSCGSYLGETTVEIGMPEKLPPLPEGKYCYREYSGAGDDKAFHENGVPTLWFRTDSPHKTIHNAADSIEKINFELLAEIILEAKKTFEYLINN